jgi:agmatinase
MTALPTAKPIRPFLDWPVVTDPSGWTADVAVIGMRHSEPYAGDPRPNDQARAPDAIRLASGQFCDGRDHWDFDIGAELSSLPPRCIDCGDIAWTEGSYDQYAQQAAERIRCLWRTGTQVFVVGGDHGVTIPVLDAMDVLVDPVHVFHVDAHLDWREEVGGVRRGYSSPLRWASARRQVCGMTQVGFRGTGSARRAELDDARAYGSHVFTAEQFHALGAAPILETIPRGVSVYVTVDADGLDPTEMPGVMAPAPGGLLFRQLAPLIRTIAQRHRIVGMDLVEVAPKYDAANQITCITAGRLLLNALGASWGAGGACRIEGLGKGRRC